jgi:ribosomal protein S20
MVKRKSQPKRNEEAEETTGANKTRKSLIKSKKQGFKALQEIKRLQKTTDLLIPKAPFLRVVS